jgi:hypothetical protein
MRHVISIAVAVVAVAACGTNKSDSSAGAACPDGWWIAGTESCSACGAAVTNPECGASDCTQFAIEGFQNGKDEYSGVITYSAKSATVSSVGSLVKRTYTVTAGSVHVDGTPPSRAATCNGAQLAWDYTSETRAPAGIASALRNVPSNGNFRSVSVPAQ